MSLFSEIKVGFFDDSGMYLNGDTGIYLLMLLPPFRTTDKPMYRPNSTHL